LQKFANAFKLVQQLEQESIEAMFKIVESAGFSRERFGEILQARQNQQTQSNVEVTQEESDKFDNAIEEITKNRQQTIASMQQAVVAEGLDVERYDQILSVVKDDEELQKQILELIQK
jgi:Holliday junction resolvase-like predicted endonuclease